MKTYATKLGYFGLSSGRVCQRFREILHQHVDFVRLSDRLRRAPRWLRWVYRRKLNRMRERYAPAAFMTAVLEEGERVLGQ